MQPYTKTYLRYYGYSLETPEYIPCEMCNEPAVDIHHIFARSIRKDLENDIINLMALCRDCHDKLGDRKQYRTTLLIRHKQHLLNEPERERFENEFAPYY